MLTASAVLLSCAISSAISTAPTAPVPTAVSAATLAAGDEPLPRRGALGLGFKPLSKSQAEKQGLKAGEGLIAQAPVPGLRWDERASLHAVA